MAVFLPAHDDHALIAVRFKIALDRVISPNAVDALKREHRHWRDELPAITVGEAIHIATNPTTGMAEPRPVPALEFSVLRPDGSQSWALRFGGNEITVECLRYTRWARVSQVALNQLARALAVLHKGTPETKVRATALEVIDQFRCTNLEYKKEDLFANSRYIPEFVYSSSPTWHNHAGWFRNPDKDPVLTQLNIDARRQEVERDDLPPEPTIFVTITHLQEKRYTPLKLASSLDHDEINATFEGFHSENKKIMIDLLNDQMAAKISLKEGEGK